ncbi:MAG: hypothetical protein WAZ94_04380 [Phycisphaerales bacterium]
MNTTPQTLSKAHVALGHSDASRTSFRLGQVAWMAVLLLASATGVEGGRAKSDALQQPTLTPSQSRGFSAKAGGLPVNEIPQYLRQLIDELAAEIRRQDHPLDRARLFGQLAKARLQAGDAKTALSYLVEAEGSLDQAPPPADSFGDRRPAIAIAIAAVQEDAGHLANAQAILRKARGFVGDRGHSSQLLSISLAQAQARDVAGAKSTFADFLDRAKSERSEQAWNRFPSEESDRRDMEQLAVELSRAEDHPGALNVLTSFQQPAWRAFQTYQLARAEMQMSKLAEAHASAMLALELSISLPKDRSREDVLRDIVELLADLGDAANARVAAKERQFTWAVDSAEEAINRVIARTGTGEQILTASESFFARQPSSSNHLRWLVDTVAKRSMFAEARTLAERITEPHERAEALLNVGVRRAQEGQPVEGQKDVSAALLSESSLPAQDQRSELLARIAEGLRLAGDASGAKAAFDRALKVAEAKVAKDGGDPTNSLLEIARVQARARDLEGTTSTCSKYLAAIRSDNTSWRMDRTMDVADLLLSIGDQHAARAVLLDAKSQMAIAGDRYWAIGIRQAKAGDIDGALTTADESPDAQATHGITEMAVIELALAGDEDRALKLAASLPEMVREEAWTAIAIRYIERRDVGRAKEAISRIVNRYNVMVVYRAMALKGDPDAARAWLGAADGTFQRVERLVELVSQTSGALLVEDK